MVAKELTIKETAHQNCTLDVQIRDTDQTSLLKCEVISFTVDELKIRHHVEMQGKPTAHVTFLHIE